MIKYGELTTKKANRKTFINILNNNILKVLHGYSVNIKKDRVRMYIECDENDITEITEKLQKIFGLHSIVICHKVNTNIDEISAKVLELLKNTKFKTFKINTKRADKKFPITSMEFNNKMGGVVSMPVNFKYIPAMRKSELQLAFKVQRGKKTYDLPRVTVAEGVISTAEIANAQELNPAITPDKFQRIIEEKYSADIMFLIQQANLRSEQLKSEQMNALHNEIKAATEAPNKELTNINVASYASPDGGVKLNTTLAENREKNTVNYMKKSLKKGKIDADMTAEFTAQDWEGFKELVSKSNIQDKELILNVLSMYSDPEQREREIKNMSSVFKVLAEEILPQLRYSRITASVNVIGKSDEEISKLAKEDAKALSVDELLYAATLVKTNKEKAAIYAKVVEIYPNDYRGYNNLGMVQYEEGDLAAAQNNFAKAARIAPNTPEVAMNQGLISLANNDYAKAEQAFGKSAGVEELNEALGVFYMKKGDYNAAVKAFGDVKSNNAALAQILTKDYSKAKATLAGVEAPNANTYYLMAVLGARTNNEQMVVSNLKKSISMDSSKAQQAATDLEFAKFDIASLVK